MEGGQILEVLSDDNEANHVEVTGIAFHPRLDPTRIDPAKKELFFDNREPAAFDFWAAVPPHKPPRAVRKSPPANQPGWLGAGRQAHRLGPTLGGRLMGFPVSL
jgi:hypothetical protein